MHRKIKRLFSERTPIERRPVGKQSITVLENPVKMVLWCGVRSFRSCRSFRWCFGALVLWCIVLNPHQPHARLKTGGERQRSFRLKEPHRKCHGQIVCHSGQKLKLGGTFRTEGRWASLMEGPTASFRMRVRRIARTALLCVFCLTMVEAENVDAKNCLLSQYRVISLSGVEMQGRTDSWALVRCILAS